MDSKNNFINFTNYFAKGKESIFKKQIVFSSSGNTLIKIPTQMGVRSFKSRQISKVVLKKKRKLLTRWYGSSLKALADFPVKLPSLAGSASL